jgi:hypothetical protein
MRRLRVIVIFLIDIYISTSELHERRTEKRPSRIFSNPNPTDVNHMYTIRWNQSPIGTQTRLEKEIVCE